MGVYFRIIWLKDRRPNQGGLQENTQSVQMNLNCAEIVRKQSKGGDGWEREREIQRLTERVHPHKLTI